MKLSHTESDALGFALRDDDTWKAIQKLMHELEASYINSVLKYNLNNGPEGLVIAKARHEGIASFIDNVKRKRDVLLKE